MVKYLEISNALRTVGDDDDGAEGGGAGGDNQVSDRYLVFIAGNALLLEVGDGGKVAIRINRIHVEVWPLTMHLAAHYGSTTDYGALLLTMAPLLTVAPPLTRWRRCI